MAHGGPEATNLGAFACNSGDMSLLTDAEKASLQADFRAANFDTFMRPLIVWQEAAQTIITEDPNFNPYSAYNQNVTNVQNTPVSVTISGLILWSKQQDWKFMKPGGGLSAQDYAGIHAKDQTSQACRLKTDASGYAVLIGAKQVMIDGQALVPESNPRPGGLFSPDRWTFYYVRSS